MNDELIEGFPNQTCGLESAWQLRSVPAIDAFLAALKEGGSDAR